MKRSRGGLSESTISDLPEEILIDILSRLSIKSIVTCRCVSKTWHNLLSSSNPQFTKLHFIRSPVQFIVQNKGRAKFLFHIAELEDDTTIKSFPFRFRLSRCDLVAVNSCNGFLCLATKYYHLNPVKVCNPITGEYLNLPKHKMADCIIRTVVSGFGFSAKTNQYKVVMLVYRSEFNPVTGHDFRDMMVDVFTIGTKSWRTIGTAPKFSDRLSSTTFFNGAIHWVCCDKLSSDYIISFDLESEKFGIVPPPTHFSTESIKEKHSITIGVLGEFLYLSYNMELWVMKEYGVQESWIKVCVVDSLSTGSYQPIKDLSGGKIFMNYRDSKLISFDPVGRIFKEFQFPQFRYFKTIAHVPSFMSFNDAMMGNKAAKLRTRMCRVRVEGRD